MMTISIIIPALNEETNIERTIEQARDGDVHEIIVVDGGSADETIARASAAGARVISTAVGRGRQLHAGAQAATGEIFLFLHADTLLPAGFSKAIREALAEPGVVAGAFRLRIDERGWSFRLIERMVAWRSRSMQMPYGDQGLFMRGEMYRAAGGFTDLPVMEDYDLVRRLRRRGRIRLVEPAVLTSARRWARGVWRTTFFNQACVMAFHLGISPARIARWR